MKLRWAYLIGLIFLVPIQCKEESNESFGSRIFRAIKSFQMAFHGENNPPQNANSPFFARPKLLEQLSLAQYCANVKHGARLQLGDCSPQFVVCESGAARFDSCPTGQIFAEGKCRQATEEENCFDVSFNQLNHATEKLVQATGFCRLHSAPGFIHVAAQPNECSRQALICATHSLPIMIACAQGSQLDGEKLECRQSSPQCRLGEKSLVQPVKTALERLFCVQHRDGEERGSSIAPSFPSQSNDLTSANNAMRCKDWFVTCPYPDKEFVFCGQDSIFDKEQGACRPTRPSDNCPAIFNCRGFEWQIIPFGKCRPEFIYCRGLIPVQFQCRPDFVLMKGKCVLVLAKSVEQECTTPGGSGEGLSECEGDHRKPDNANCTRFFQCEEDSNSIRRWQHYECPEKEGFDPHLEDCSPNYQCEAVCSEGQSFLVNCYEYFRCHDHRFQPGVCPSKSRYSVEENRCIFDETCRHRDNEDNYEKPIERCNNGEFIRSKDCISYGVCKESTIIWKPCQLLNGQYHDQCPECAPHHETSREIERHPDVDLNFSPTDCADGSVVLSRNDCRRFMRCYAGHWIMVECPNGKFFDLKTQTCTADKCESSGIYLPPVQFPGSIPDFKPAVEAPSCTTSSCCTSENPKLGIPTDCKRFKQCDINIGRYVEYQCPYYQHFNSHEQKCVEGSECDVIEGEDSNEICVDGSMKPIRKCGHLRLCKNGKWMAARCKNGMKFLGTRCSKTSKCEDPSITEIEQEISTDVCFDQESKRHPYSCNKYLVCDHGIFVERICSYGALFNPMTQRCDLNYECDYKNQPKCYEGQKKASKHNCHAYLRCFEGRYVEEICPNEKVYNDQVKECVRGSCNDSHEDNEEFEHSNERNKQSRTKQKDDFDNDDGAPKDVPCSEASGTNGYRRDRKRCSRFYQCSNGDWVPKTCPSGTVFNTHIAVCDWPRNVPGCEAD